VKLSLAVLMMLTRYQNLINRAAKSTLLAARNNIHKVVEQANEDKAFQDTSQSTPASSIASPKILPLRSYAFKILAPALQHTISSILTCILASYSVLS